MELPTITHKIQQIHMRTLLIDRFNLSLHRESKRLPVYELVVNKNGPKIQAVGKDIPEPFELYSNFRFVPAAGGVTELHGYGNLGQLSDFLTRVAGRPVLDRTGIAGIFDIQLICAIDGYPGLIPTVFNAVQSQLGLRLEARTSTVEITVIDAAEKPKEN